ncbi:uncharacterized protein LOC133530101 isoform X2 [Cydia pomonella]|nr:uncharacterized protein LOC133530101 isoform X2 [Cydia pomonella]
MRHRNFISSILSGTPAKNKGLAISNPHDFRMVSAIIDVDIVPETCRRVKLLKHGSDRPLGFFIRDGTSVRVTPGGVERAPGIFISRLVPGGLAESTGLLGVNDEVLEVNGIDVCNKTLDQVSAGLCPARARRPGREHGAAGGQRRGARGQRHRRLQQDAGPGQCGFVSGSCPAAWPRARGCWGSTTRCSRSTASTSATRRWTRSVRVCVRLVPGGLAESTGLLGVNDEVLEVNGIDVCNKTLDQVSAGLCPARARRPGREHGAAGGQRRGARGQRHRRLQQDAGPGQCGFVSGSCPAAWPRARGCWGSTTRCSRSTASTSATRRWTR